ncbi:MAG TPA: tellurite resistance TerB family protein [Saprospiraceae bacterium]|nr:tellurite resistance TerB family protein [Cyclobacteriaceae bacterium]HNN69406.1 tellurite resistance TerB family protein [Saprospiraceae bacterium]
MKSNDFQDFLFKSAVMVMSCDGEIAQSEIDELENIISNEIYLLGYNHHEPLKSHIDEIRTNGKDAINKFLEELSRTDLSQKQELILIEVLIKMIEADSIIQPSEIKFFQLIKSKLKTSEESLIIHFPKQVSFIIESNQYGFNQEFTDEISLK